MAWSDGDSVRFTQQVGHYYMRPYETHKNLDKKVLEDQDFYIKGKLVKYCFLVTIYIIYTG